MKPKLFVVALASLLASSLAEAADITVLAGGATRETILELLPAFEKSTGHKVMPTWAPAPVIRRKLAIGETFDLVIVGADDIDGFIRQGKLVPGSRTDLMKTGIGVAVRAGAPRPDIGSVAALKRALLAVPTIGHSAGTSGEYVVSLIARLGLADALTPRLRPAPDGVRVSVLLVKGEAEIGLQQASELIHEPGIDYLGPLPPELQKTTIYAAGLHTAAPQPEAAKALLRALTGPDAATAIRNHGMDPG
jgi:molybdate transport system substrate-binding protein